MISEDSPSNVVNDITNIYRNYWRTELLKENNADKTDSVLFKELSEYLTNNHLTDLSIDSLSRSISNKIELKKVIEREGVNCSFFYPNGFQDILIWDKQTEKEYSIDLPEDTLTITVVFIENYLLRSLFRGRIANDHIGTGGCHGRVKPFNFLLPTKKNLLAN